MKWQAKVIKILEANNWLVINVTSASKNGTSDLIALRNGVCLFIECKAGKDTQSYLQKRFERNVTKEGFIYILADDKEPIDNLLKQIK